MKKTIVALLLAAIAGAGIWLGWYSAQPRRIPKSAAEDAVYQQILADIQAMTAVPHSVGTKANDQVREYLVSRIHAAGLEAQLQPFSLHVADLLQEHLEYYNNSGKAYHDRVAREMKDLGFATLEEYFNSKVNPDNLETLQANNILVKVDAPNTQNAIMLVAHYDSVSSAPGAADDMLAVATMLNLLENLPKDIQSSQSDFYFLFTDGEELGLLGAQHFVQSYPEYFSNIRLLFNFEARGNAGTPVMFETSANNYDMVRMFAQSTPHPVSFSLATAIYDSMPNGTDFTEFKNVGYRGLNFAIIDGSDSYHRPTDTLENLNKNSAYEYYQTIFSMAHYFSFVDTNSIQHTSDAVFFPFSEAGLIVIQGNIARVIGFIPLLLWIAILVAFYYIRKPAFTSTMVKKALALAPLGLLPPIITLAFFPASYLFFIPAILFFGLEALLLFFRQQPRWIHISVMIICLLTCGFLYAPIVYLIQVALGSLPVTLGFALLPAIPCLIYSVRVVRLPAVQPSGKTPNKPAPKPKKDKPSKQTPEQKRVYHA